MTKTAEKFYMRNLSALHCVWDQAHRQSRGLALWHCISSHGALWCLCQTILRVCIHSPCSTVARNHSKVCEWNLIKFRQGIAG